MRVRVKHTTKASPDGIAVETYCEGETYDMPDALGGVFVREGWGVDQDAPAPKVTKPAKAGPAKRKG